MSRRSVFSVAVLSLSVLTACGASAPPAKELADELIDTLDESDSVKECMHAKVADFTVIDPNFSDLDAVANAADGGNAQAERILADFEATLASCR